MVETESLLSTCCRYSVVCHYSLKYIFPPSSSYSYTAKRMKSWEIAKTWYHLFKIIKSKLSVADSRGGFGGFSLPVE